MKFKVKKSDLQVVLRRLGGIVNPRAPLPVLACVRVVAKGAKTLWTASDLTVSAEYAVPATVEAEGVAVIPAQRLALIVDKSPAADSDISVTVKGDRIRIVVSGLNTKYEMASLPADTYPELDTAGREVVAKFAIGGGALKRMVERVSFAVSTSDVGPSCLQGINIAGKGGFVRMAATDGKKLATTRVKYDVGDFDITVPVKALRTLVDGLPDDAEVKVHAVGNMVKLKAEGVNMCSRLLEEKYPDIAPLVPLPKNAAKRVKFDVEAFAGEVDRVGIMADEKTRRIEMAFGDGEIKMTCQSGTTGGASTSKLSAETKGDGEMVMSFSLDFLKELIKNLSVPEMLLYDSAKAAMFVDEDEYVCLLMPIRG